jgi:high-affinity iron transporter
MLNAFFVVWRESLEALLITGILYAWLRADDPDGKGRRALFLGVAAGIVLALGLGWALLHAQNELTGKALEAFQIGALLLAVALISQMVLWMNHHGRTLKTQLQNDLALAQERRGQWGILLIAALAVAREGAETVIFLYGLAQGGEMSALLTGSVGGFVVALLTAWAAARGLGRLRLGLLLRLSSLLLLVLASSLLVAASDRAVDFVLASDAVADLDDWLPFLTDPVWDTSGIVDNNGNAGRFLADFLGYRAQPAQVTLLVWSAYWLLILLAHLGWRKWQARRS